MEALKTLIIVIAAFAAFIGVSMKTYSCKSQDVYQNNMDTRYYNLETINDTVTQPCQYVVIFNEEYIRIIDHISKDTYDLTGHYNGTQMQFYPDSNELHVTHVRILNHALYLIDKPSNWQIRLTQTE